jgi:hypothetical protein
MAKEDKWIEVLSGKSKPNPKNKDEIEASYLREAIGSYEKKIGLNNPNPEFSFYRFEQLLKEKDQHKASTGFINKLKHYKWETLRLIAATAAGIAIATLPTVQLATKGVESASPVDRYENSRADSITDFDTFKATQVINLISKNPIEESTKIYQLASESNMEVSSKPVGLNMQLFITTFDDKNTKANKLKELLNLKKDFSGSVTIIISRAK